MSLSVIIKSWTRQEKASWLVFAAVSAQLALQFPSWKLIPWERTNLFSALLCLAASAVAALPGLRRGVRASRGEVMISAALAALALLSTLFSLTPGPSLLRVAALLISGLGGFWCARFLLDTPAGRELFMQLCLALLTLLVALSLLGYWISAQFYGWGRIEFFLNMPSHALANLILLLMAAPLALLLNRSGRQRAAGGALLLAGYAVLCLSQRISTVFIPIFVVLLGAMLGVVRRRYLVGVVLAVLLVLGFFSRNILWHKLNLEYSSYRLENIPFSWKIAKEHPWWGIGLRAPRDRFLEGYQVNHSYPADLHLRHLPEAKDRFAEDLRTIVSPDNMVLTFMTGLGFPFLLLYGGAVLILGFRLVRLALRPAPAAMTPPPLVLLFPILVGIIHFQFFDGLLFLPNCWFFHIFLGLIPPFPAEPGIGDH